MTTQKTNPRITDAIQRARADIATPSYLPVAAAIWRYRLFTSVVS